MSLVALPLSDDIGIRPLRPPITAEREPAPGSNPCYLTGEVLSSGGSITLLCQHRHVWRTVPRTEWVHSSLQAMAGIAAADNRERLPTQRLGGQQIDTGEASGVSHAQDTTNQ